jgi:hypothetical protein
MPPRLRHRQFDSARNALCRAFPYTPRGGGAARLELRVIYALIHILFTSGVGAKNARGCVIASPMARR